MAALAFSILRGVHATRMNVFAQRREEQCAFVAEGVIHTLSADAHDLHQVIGRRGSVALFGKEMNGTL